MKQAQGGITIGLPANHIWSVAGDNDRGNVSNTFLQPFLSKTRPNSTTFSLGSESTYNWQTKQWIIPVVVGVTRIFSFGNQAVQIGSAAKYYVTSPTGGPEWGIRLNVTLLFPKK